MSCRWTFVSALTLLASLSAVCPWSPGRPKPARGQVLIDFDDGPTRVAITDRYAGLGVRLTGPSDTLTFTVETDESCVPTSSPPNALTLDYLGECPEINDQYAWYRVDFQLPQPRVSIMVTHVEEDTVTYLRGFDGNQFLDWQFGQPGLVNVPRRLELTRDPNERWLTAVEFGAFQASGTATFDDLSFEFRPLSTGSFSWGTIKSRF